MQKKKILILGGTGFIGRNLVLYFSKKSNFEVVTTYNKKKKFNCKNVKWLKADLTEPLDVEKVIKDIDIIIQAAATTSGSKDIVEKPMLHVTDNLIMNSLIFRKAYEKKVNHIIFFSCTVMYQSSKTGLKEDDLDLNKKMYDKYFGIGWTKVSLEKQCEFYASLGKTKFTVLRHSNIFGPYDKFDLEKSHVFGATVTKVMSCSDGEKITVWGEGKEGRDLLYIDDLINAIDLILINQLSRFSVYNVGYGKSIQIKDLVSKIVKFSGKKITIEYDTSKPSIKTNLFLDCKKIFDEIGWKRSTNFDDAVKRTIKWWKKNINIEKKN